LPSLFASVSGDLCADGEVLLAVASELDVEVAVLVELAVLPAAALLESGVAIADDERPVGSLGD